jgi:peptidoglycan/xylan/chitin deacetylase (PgdA/CDA1 family)
VPTEHGSALIIVNYHYIRDRSQYPYPGIHPIGREEFVRQIQWLKSRYNMATPEEVESFAYNEKPLPAPSVFLTFDDGLAEHIIFASEVLDPLGIKAAFFVSTMPLIENHALMVHKIHWLRATTDPERFREQFMRVLADKWRQAMLNDKTSVKALRAYPYDTPENALLKYLINYKLPPEIADLAGSEMLASRGISESAFCEETYMNEGHIRCLSENGHIIGSHGHSHAPFSKLDSKTLENELNISIAYLEKTIGLRPRWISYPYGMRWSISEDTGRICRDLGFKIGLGLDKDEWGWNTGEELPLWLKRINTNDVEEMCGGFVS